MWWCSVAYSASTCKWPGRMVLSPASQLEYLRQQPSQRGELPEEQLDIGWCQPAAGSSWQEPLDQWPVGS